MPNDKAAANGWFARALIAVALFIADSRRYQRIKTWARGLLGDERNPRKRYFDLFMITLVLASVGLLIYGVKHPLPPAMSWFDELAMSIFAIEYLLRGWVFSDIHRRIIDDYERCEFVDARYRPWPSLRAALRDKWRYASSPMAVIDLLAILPSYRPIRLLRVFLLFRLFKLFRYAQGVSIITEILEEKRFEIFTLALFAGFMVLVGSAAVYLFEADLADSPINTVFDAVYWSVVTLSTVGYGDITPITNEGRFVAMVVIVSGIGVFAFSTSIIVSAFQEKLGPMRDNRIYGDLQRRRGYTVVCGFGRVGEVVVEHLAASGDAFVIVERDLKRVELAVARGYRVVHADASSAETMERIGLGERAATLLCVTGSDVTNVFVTISARSLNPHLIIIARANRQDVVHKLELAGADNVVAPFQIVGLTGSEYVGKPVAFDAFRDIIADDKNIVLQSLRIDADSPLLGATLASLDLTRRKLVLFGVIRDGADCPADTVDAGQTSAHNIYPLSHGHFHYNPAADFVIEPNDLLIVFGHEYSLTHARHLLESGALTPQPVP